MTNPRLAAERIDQRQDDHVIPAAAPVLRTASERHRLSRLVQFAILFIGGFNYALPAHKWATPVQVFHGVFLNDLLTILYIAALPVAARSLVIAPNARVLGFAGLIAALGACGVVSAGVNGYSLLDFGEAGKLVLFSGYFLLVARWCQTRGETFVLRSYLGGIAVGGVINLYYSVVEPNAMMFGIPVLRSRNSAGGLLGLSIGLAAWLMLNRRTRTDARIACAVTLVGLAAASISYSKTAMTVAACGIGAWFFVVTGTIGFRRSRRMGLAIVAALVLAGAYVAQTNSGVQAIETVRTLVRHKFTDLDLSNKYSVGARYMYFWGVLEVLDRHPLVGVGYSGFYDAITQTATYRTGRMADESIEGGALGQSNPHNSFLYYASANGIPGLVIALALFCVFMKELLRVSVGRGVSALGVCACVSLAYFIYGNTLPTLFNTDVLYVLAAVAMARVTRLHAARVRAASAPPHTVAMASRAQVTP